jgi:hypothetical protein
MAPLVDTPKTSQSAQRRLATHWRAVISVAILLHLTAIIAAPWSGPEPSGPLVASIVRPFGPYLDATYSGHGYRFFCPAPGPSHLIRYTLKMPDGSTISDVFPNLQTEWPRLFYHRHFMLTDKLANLWHPEQPDSSAPPEAREEWRRFREAFEAITRSYALHLMDSRGATEATLEFVQHNLPSPQLVVEGKSLSDPASYEVLWTGTFKTDTP